jgi:hypothetical protein
MNDTNTSFPKFVEIEKKELAFYYPETNYFIYIANENQRRNKSFKFSLQGVQLKYHAVANDMVLTSTNNLKTFYEINTNVLRTKKKLKKLIPLSLLGIAKRDPRSL